MQVVGHALEALQAASRWGEGGLEGRQREEKIQTIKCGQQSSKGRAGVSDRATKEECTAAEPAERAPAISIVDSCVV
jgi:hypothetical protein